MSEKHQQKIAYKVAEAAEMVSVSRPTLQRWIDDKNLPYNLPVFRLESNGGIRILHKDLIAFMERYTHEQPVQSEAG